MSVQDDIKTRVADLNQALSDCAGVLVASSDGLVIAAELPSTIDPERVAAMAATSLGLGDRIVATLGLGSLDEKTVKATNGSLHLFMTGPNAVLAIMANPNVNLGMLNLEARAATRDLAKLVA